MSETEKKRRFAAGRKTICGFCLDYHQVFYDLDRAIVHAKVRNEYAWSVFELHDVQSTELKETGIILPYAITCEAKRNGATEELIYDTRASERTASLACVSQGDSVYYMTVIDHAGKEEAKEDFVMSFYPGPNGRYSPWLMGYIRPADTQLGWVDGEYRVKIQLPVNREVPRAN